MKIKNLFIVFIAIFGLINTGYSQKNMNKLTEKQKV